VNSYPLPVPPPWEEKNNITVDKSPQLTLTIPRLPDCLKYIQKNQEIASLKCLIFVSCTPCSTSLLICTPSLMENTRKQCLAGQYLEMWAWAWKLVHSVEIWAWNGPRCSRSSVYFSQEMTPPTVFPPSRMNSAEEFCQESVKLFLSWRKFNMKLEASPLMSAFLVVNVTKIMTPETVSSVPFAVDAL